MTLFIFYFMSVTIPKHVVILFFAVACWNKSMTLMAKALNDIAFPHSLFYRFYKWFTRDGRDAVVELFVVPFLQ